MGEHFNGHIRIGGQLKEDDLEEFIDLLNEEGLWYDWVKSERDDEITEEGLRKDATEKQPLHLFDDQASWGQFERLEKWLDTKGMPWIRYSDSHYEVDAEVMVSTPEEKFSLPTNNDGDPMVPMYEVKNAIAALKEGRLHDALDMLAKCVVDIPDLPPFEIVP